MRAITLYQPWAQFMAIGWKTFETRPKRIKYRGDICIHAAAYMPCVSRIVRLKMEHATFIAAGGMIVLPRKAIVAVVELYDCLPTEEVREEARSFGEIDLGNYTAGRFAYMTRKLRRLREPVPCRGMQAVSWEVPADVAKLVEAQL